MRAQPQRSCKIQSLEVLIGLGLVEVNEQHIYMSEILDEAGKKSQDFIQVEKDKPVQEISKGIIDQSLENCWSIGPEV